MAKGGQSAIRNASNAESELIQLVLGTLAAAVIMGTALWLTGSARIVYFTSPIFKAFGWLYNLVPGGQENWGRINYLYAAFRLNPREVGIGEFLVFTDLTLRPLAYASVAVMACVVGWTFTRSANNLARKPSPELLTKILSAKFTGIIPVMHLGQKLLLDQLPRWRDQTWPEEVLQKYKIDGKPMLTDGKVNADQVRKYFQGELKLIKGTRRRFSRMLGAQVVDLVGDRGKKVCYPDRMSSEGKVMFALLVAHAFGGKDGKADYNKAMDQLNRSCTLNPQGMPNLTVAQWLFDKYRTNAKAHELFAIHHWEYTYLYAMFFLAKRQGKVTHRQWIWLKPTNRILFYVLNTVLRKAPHTESAGAWAQFDFERKAAQMHRLPVAEDGTPMVVTRTAEEAMVAYWDHYAASADDDTDAWWSDGSAWARANNVELKAPPLPPSEALNVADQDPRFDHESAKARGDIEAKFNARWAKEAEEVLKQD